VSATPDGVYRRFDRVQAGDQDYVNAGVVLQGFFKELESVHVRHFQVRQNHAAGSEPHVFQRLLRARCAYRGEAGFFQARSDEFDVVGIIVQYADS
jgi:hypothetical protein